VRVHQVGRREPTTHDKASRSRRWQLVSGHNVVSERGNRKSQPGDADRPDPRFATSILFRLVPFNLKPVEVGEHGAELDVLVQKRRDKGRSNYVRCKVRFVDHCNIGERHHFSVSGSSKSSERSTLGKTISRNANCITFVSSLHCGLFRSAGSCTPQPLRRVHKHLTHEPATTQDEISRTIATRFAPCSTGAFIVSHSVGAC